MPETGIGEEIGELQRNIGLPLEGVLRCTLCGAEIPQGESYWHCNGQSICGVCLAEFARTELAPYRCVRGREAKA